MIEFHLPIVPPKATSQGAGRRMVIVNGKPMFFKNKAAASAEHDLLTLCAPNRPESPIQGPISLHVRFVWPWRKSEPKWRRAIELAHHTSKPDCSNIIKQLEDCLTKLRFWNDDAQISALMISKYWGDDVGITVSITPLAEKVAVVFDDWFRPLVKPGQTVTKHLMRFCLPNAELRDRPEAPR